MAGPIGKLTRRQLSKTDEAAYRGLRSTLDVDPLLDEELAALKKKEKSSELTAREEKRLDALMNRRIREGGAEKPEGMSRVMKERGLTEKEKKELQESLNYKKGGMVKAKKKKAVSKPKAFSVGGYAKLYGKK